MSREDKNVIGLHSRTARFFLWTIRRQEHIRYLLTMNVWIYVYILLVLALFTPIRIETALHILLISGLALGASLWILIERRRSWLLGIRDARLRETAHRVMIDYIRKKVGSDR
jgi:hypothetical protein